MTQLTIMLTAGDRGRADVLLTPSRVYYRLATPDTAEDGDLPGLNEPFEAVASRILDAVKMAEGEEPIDCAYLRLRIFIDNTAHPVAGVSRESIHRLATQLESIDGVFGFVRGF